MVRRALRIVSLIILLVLVAGPVVGAVHPTVVPMPHAVALIFESGINFWWCGFSNPALSVTYSHHGWSPMLLWKHPHIFQWGNLTDIFLPWWLILSVWSGLTALVWFLARRKKIGTRFPIEPDPPMTP